MIFSRKRSAANPTCHRCRIFICLILLIRCSQVYAINVGLKAGDIVVTQQSSGHISVVDPVSGSVATPFSNGSFTGLSEVILDNQNRAVVATRSSYGVLRFDFTTGTSQSIAAAPFALDSASLAFERTGNLLVGNRDDWLTRVNLTTGAQQHLSLFSDDTGIQDIQVAADGSIYVLDGGSFNFGGGRVIKVDPNNGMQQVLAEGGQIQQGSDMVIGPDGNLIVLSSNGPSHTSTLLRIDINTGQQQFLKSIGDVGFITLDVDNTLLFAAFYSKSLYRVNLTTGSLKNIGNIGGTGNITGIAVVAPEPGLLGLLLTCVSMLAMRRPHR